MRYALVGYGRMGRAVEQAAATRGHTLVRIVDPTARGRAVRRRIDQGLDGADVAFEFTAPQAAEQNVVQLLRAGVPVVCGTTGWDAASAAVARAARSARVGAVIAPNFSIGMALFAGVLRELARRAGATGQYDPFVLEHHHRAKADAPSGTASLLAAILVEEDPRRWTLQTGTPMGPLPSGAVHVASVRAGHEPGVHTVGFDGEHEQLTLTHRSRGRGGFAAGAVLAAEWIQGRRGIHAFEEVVADACQAGGAR